MASGIMFAIVCPMLEDELIFSLENDADTKNVCVLDAPYNGSFKKKMNEHGVGFSTMSEEQFMSGDNGLDRSKYNVVVRMKDLGLHRDPAKLKETVEKDLTDLQGKVDCVALYYGMCGNFGWDPSEWANDNLDYPVRIFKDEEGRVIDDCVGVAVGGLDGYRSLLREYKATMFFTPAIATNWLDFLSASDMMAYFEGSDDVETTKANLKMVMKLAEYRGVTQIDTGYEDREEFDKCTKDFADYNEFETFQCRPDLVDQGPAKRLYAESKALLS